MNTRISPDQIKARKGTEPIVCLTAYDTPTARLIGPHCDLLLVGDSLAMVLYGMESTRGIDLDVMIRHGQAVMRAEPKSCVVVDMPYGSYEDSPEQALASARRIIDNTGADGIKLEGGANMAPQIKTITDAGIAVMAHIGLLPQSAPDEGGFKVKGKTPEQKTQLLTDAKAVAEAGAFAVVIEGTIEPVSAAITKAIDIPTIGIGASAVCDGQVLVTEDMLGYFERSAKFVRRFADLDTIISSAAKDYARNVKARRFPGEEHCYQATPAKKAS